MPEEFGLLPYFDRTPPTIRGGALWSERGGVVYRSFFLYILRIDHPSMFAMFELILFVLLIFMISSLAGQILFRVDTGPFKVLINITAFLGVIVHELSHWTFCKLFGVPTEKIGIKYRGKMGVNPHGYVMPAAPGKITFMQMCLISFAPLFVSSWLAWLCMDLLFAVSDVLLWALLLFLLISLILGAAPSFPDMKNIVVKFRLNPQYAFYQVILVFISGAICWILILVFEIEILMGMLYYAAVISGYYLLKYTLLGVKRGQRRHQHSVENRPFRDCSAYKVSHSMKMTALKLDDDDALW